MLNVEFRWYVDKVRKILLTSAVTGQNLLARTYAKKITCPVCGKEIREAKYAGAMITVEGKKYYFGTYACKTKFVKYPEKYMNNEIDF